MSRTHVHRRSRRSSRAERADGTVAPGLALVGSFVIGMALEWLRTYVSVFQADWRADLLAILAAAWLCILLLVGDADSSERDLPRRSGLALGLLLFGSVVMHQVLSRF